MAEYAASPISRANIKLAYTTATLIPWFFAQACKRWAAKQGRSMAAKGGTMMIAAVLSGEPGIEGAGMVFYQGEIYRPSILTITWPRLSAIDSLVVNEVKLCSSF